MREESFDSFYRATRRRVLHQAFALTGDLPAAQSAVRDAYVGAWQHWRKVSRLDDPLDWVRPRAWQLAQRRHTARIWHRNKGLSEEHKAVLDALAKLPGAQRRVLLLTDVADLDVTHAARELGVTRDVAEQNQRQARVGVATALGVEPEVAGARLVGLDQLLEHATLPRGPIVRRAGRKRRQGQFLSWRFLTGRGWSRANPYSISAAPDGRSLRITVQAVGDGSSASFGLKPGTRALVEGPYGRLSARTRTQPKVALIGAGVGITPLRALAEGLDYAPGDAILLQRYTDDPLFARELEILGRDRGLQVLDLPGRRRRPDSWLGDRIGTADDLTALRYWIPDIADRDVFVCGPEPWTALVRATLLDAGVHPDLIHLETFAW